MDTLLIENILFILILICTGLFGTSFSNLMINLSISNKRRILLKKHAGISDDNFKLDFLVEGIKLKILLRLVKESYSNDTNQAFFLKFIKNYKLSKKLSLLAKYSGMPERFNNFAMKKVQITYSVFVGLVGALIGFIFSNLLMTLMLISGVILGFYFPIWAMKSEKELRKNTLEKNLPEMLEIICLALRSGVSFDRGWYIYVKNINNQLSKSCSIALKKWESGLLTRETSLRELALSYDSQMFNRIIENIIRSLRFGTNLSEYLERSSEEARTYFKSMSEENISKAPVKMMIPTGTLILPAMLILVLGPILLELINGF